MKACIAIARSPIPVTASDPLSEFPFGARASHASSLTRRRPR